MDLLQWVQCLYKIIQIGIGCPHYGLISILVKNMPFRVQNPIHNVISLKKMIFVYACAPDGCAND